MTNVISQRPSSLLIVLLLIHAGTPQAAEVDLGDITVTGTREETLKAETPAAIGTMSAQEIKAVRPAHPSELTSRIPGVQVSVTGGEGHQTGIRQPISTSPLYLYLEDGIPTRSTGFFNHNALYEVNVPQAAGLEITKGPGTSLYGSDAIGGVINVLTRPAPAQREIEINAEAGEHGWKRLLLSAGDSWENDGVRADVNLTSTDGWRDATDYERQSATLRWDRFTDHGATFKTVLALSNIDQQTAGSSTISETDYLHDPTANYTPISYREVQAARLSVAYEKETTDTLLSITPYVRHNSMDYMPNWSFSYDPKISDTNINSFGMLFKYRKDFAPQRTRLVVGADVDYSPGSKLEHSIDAIKTGDIYTSYTVGDKIYDYDVTFASFSPYIHLETSFSDKLRLNAGLRYDAINYDYDNLMTDAQVVVNPTSMAFAARYNHPADTEVSFHHLSPKAGITYAFTDRTSGFLSYRHAFRVPSEGQLFTPGKSLNTTNLKPVKADSYEIGIRSKRGKRLSYEASLYYMKKKDDIITYEYPDKSRETLNAGETLHKGIEAGMEAQLMQQLVLGFAYSYSIHTYEDWRPKSTVDYSGNEMPFAPRQVANLHLEWSPALLNGGHTELELEHQGSYWTDDANTAKYPGHNILNLRANYQAANNLEFYGRIMNLTDRRYATRVKGSAGSLEYAPGLPRTVYLGVNYTFN